MKSLAGTETEKNLLKAFAGESQARNRYTFFAKVALKEGYKQIEAIFLETAEHEQSHASRFWKFLEGNEVEILAKYPAGKTGTTMANLEMSANGEAFEHSSLYPEFARIAEQEGFLEVATAFKSIAKVEREHEKRFRKLAKNILEGKTFKRDEPVRWKCRKCGYIHEGTQALQNCPACLHPQDYFEIEAENY